VLGGGDGNGLAGCTVEGASGMFWSCWFVPEETPEFALFPLVPDCPCSQATPAVRRVQTPASHTIRQKCPQQLRNPSSRFYALGCKGQQIWCI
jgi:hypothetical protein